MSDHDAGASALRRAAHRCALPEELRRELPWAAAVLLQVPLLLLLAVLGRLLLRYPWFEDLFQIPNETVLLPALLGIISIGPLILAMLIVWACQLVQRERGSSLRAGATAHFAAALAGALALFECLAWAEEGHPVISALLLVPSVPFAAILFCILYWPRLAFRSLRAPTPASPR